MALLNLQHPCVTIPYHISHMISKFAYLSRLSALDRAAMDGADQPLFGETRRRVSECKCLHTQHTSLEPRPLLVDGGFPISEAKKVSAWKNNNYYYKHAHTHCQTVCTRPSERAGFEAVYIPTHAAEVSQVFFFFTASSWPVICHSSLLPRPLFPKAWVRDLSSTIHISFIK